MPITELGWELLIERRSTQMRTSDAKIRTVGRYQVFNDGVAVPTLSGTTAESAGPGSNSRKGVRVEPGSYALATQAGGRYATIGYTSNANHAALKRPAFELLGTGTRSEILVHPGIGFLSSIGCINLCRILPEPSEPMSYAGSRNRVIAVIDNMREFLGTAFPDRDGRSIPRAWVIIEGEP